jgi:uncharacterized protein YndB with AHSA1/START domain
MKRFVLAVAAVAVALSVGLVLVGAFLPREHVAASEVAIRRPPEDVWALVRDFARTPRWWSDVEHSSRVEGQLGRERWRQVVNGFAVEFDVVTDDPPRRLVTQVVAEGVSPFGGQWTYELTPDGAETRVRVTEEGWVGPWPFRSVALLYGHHRSLDRYLVSLGQQFGQVVTPTRIEPPRQP